MHTRTLTIILLFLSFGAFFLWQQPTLERAAALTRTQPQLAAQAKARQPAEAPTSPATDQHLTSSRSAPTDSDLLRRAEAAVPWLHAQPTSTAPESSASAAVSAAATSAETRCFPPAFTAKSLVIDPVNNFFDETAMYYDKLTQRQRVDITFNNPNETPLHVRVFLFPKLGVAYRVTPQPDGGDTCVSSAYNVLLDPLCLQEASGNHTRLPSRRIGSQVAQSWVVSADLTNDTYRILDTGASYLVPYDIESRAKSSPYSLATYLSYYDTNPYAYTLPDHTVFDLPDACEAFTLAQNTDITFAQQASATHLTPGQLVTFTFTVANQSLTNTARHLLLSDTLPTGLQLLQGATEVASGYNGRSLVSPPSQPLTPTDPITVHIALLEPGDVVTITLVAQVANPLVNVGDVINTATLRAQRTDSDVDQTNNVTLTLGASPTLANLSITLDSVADSVANIRFTGALGTFILDDITPQDGDAYSNNHTVQVPTGIYTITELIPPHWLLDRVSCMPAANLRTFNPTTGQLVVMLTGGDVQCTFYNQRQVLVHANLFEDRDGSGRHNLGEPTLSGWTVRASNTTLHTVSATQTNRIGNASFGYLLPGSYSVCLDLAPNWITTLPGGGERCYLLNLAPGAIGRVRFGVKQGAVAAQVGAPVSGVKIWPNGDAQRDGDDPYFDLAGWVDPFLLTPFEENEESEGQAQTKQSFLPLITR